MIGFEQIRIISPYQIKKIEDLQLEWKPNHHCRLVVRGIVEETDQVNAALYASVQDVIHVYTQEESTENTLFKGWVTAVQVTNVNGVYFIELEGLSGSFSLDIKKKRRSFQDTKMTYPSLIRKIIETYPGHDFISSKGDGVSIGTPIFQYEETDWELLQRLASHFHTVLVCDILEAKPRFYFGLPFGKQITLPEEISYTAHKDLLAFQKAGGYAAGRDENFFYYEIHSGERYAIGDEIRFRNKQLVVSEVKAALHRGQLLFTYRLSRMEGVRQERRHNHQLSGISLEGKVLDVQGEVVKLHLAIDSEQSVSKAHWFPFAPPTGNAMYCLPKVGTQASLYFSDATAQQPLVLGCVRTNGGNCEKTGNPNIRYFGTEHGSELEMSPTGVHIVSGCQEPLSIHFDDETGITMTSHKKLVLNAKEEISLYTPKRVVIRAQSQLFAKKSKVLSGFSMESEYHFLSELVKAEGRDRTAYLPLTMSPRKEKPLHLNPHSIGGN